MGFNELNSVENYIIKQLTGVINGDDAKSNKYVKGVLEQAEKEGWVLNPQWANPGAQDYIEPDDQQQDDMIDLIKSLDVTK